MHRSPEMTVSQKMKYLFRFRRFKCAKYDVIQYNKASIPDLGARFHRSRYRGHND